MTAYYNEHDPFAAAWLRELIKDNLIAPGEVDERSIEDVTPNDLRSFRQCHFFAGIGVWSLAARRTGWDDDAPLWSGSCPCQPFSAAGKGEGFADERHLWPAFFHLIEQCRPPLIVGEQVAGADGDSWFDLVSSDLDAAAYAFGVAETCAAGFGAPHIRSRNYWVAVADRSRSQGLTSGWSARQGGEGSPLERNGPAHRLADSDVSSPARHRGDSDALEAAARLRDGHSDSRRTGGLADAEHDDGRADQPERGQDRGTADGGVREPMRVADGIGIGQSAGRDAHRSDDGHQPGAVGEVSDERLADLHGDGRDQGRGGVAATGNDGAQRDGADGGMADDAVSRRGGISTRAAETDGWPPQEFGRLRPSIGHNRRPGPVNGLWDDADWLRCRDAKWRAVEPGTFPLANAGAFRNRVGLLRGAGNAVNLAQAEGFLEAVRASVK
jgi:DNA (cytosine-5)-methyltransferase 1